MLTLIFLALFNAKAPMPFETAVLIVNIAREESVDPLLLAKIVVVESRGNPLAVNKKTKDYGIAQINLKSHPQVTYACAMNKACGLRAGAKILAKTKRACHYNTGKAKFNPRRLQKCLRYEEKLAKVE